MTATSPQRGRLTRVLRTLHAWLGIFIFPWVIVIGATGFYLNHENLVLSLLATSNYDETQFDAWPAGPPVTEAAARDIAQRVWPGEDIRLTEEVGYHNRPTFQFTMESGRVIVTRPTGHYFVKTGFLRRTYAPDGSLLHSKVYWGSLFKRLHVTGWVDSRLGTWLADMTSIAMVLFGLTGVVLWWTPRSRRILRLLGLGVRRRSGPEPDPRPSVPR